MDPIACAAAPGPPLALPPPEAMQRAEAAYASCMQAADYGGGLERLLGFVKQFPGSERLQLLSARLLDRLAGRAHAITTGRRLANRFPLCHDAVLIALRWTRWTADGAIARAELQARLRRKRAPDWLALQVRGWAKAGNPPRPKRCLDRLSRL